MYIQRNNVRHVCAIIFSVEKLWVSHILSVRLLS